MFLIKEVPDWYSFLLKSAFLTPGQLMVLNAFDDGKFNFFFLPEHFSAHFVDAKLDKTGVINDSLGQPTVPAFSDFEILGRTDGRTDRHSMWK